MTAPTLQSEAYARSNLHVYRTRRRKIFESLER